MRKVVIASAALLLGMACSGQGSSSGSVSTTPPPGGSSSSSGGALSGSQGPGDSSGASSGAGSSAVSGGASSASAPACRSHAGCVECVQDPSCGYCGQSQACTEGLEDGPSTGTCGAEWTYYVEECPDFDAGPDPCLQYSGCGACVAAACAFCLGDSSCHRSAGACGTDAGSTQEVWQCPGYDAGPDRCPAASTCDQCTGERGCGFCVTTNTCHRGGTNGPDDASCAAADWVSYAEDCATP